MYRLIRHREIRSTCCALKKFAQFSNSANQDNRKLAPLVKIPTLGSVQGSVTEGAWTGRQIYQYLGIHYAQSPDGCRRFKAPIPAKPWTGIKDATQYGKTSPFIGTIKNYTAEQIATENLEDSLSLCVYSSDLKTPKPVMVYIHGGDYYSGGSDQHPPHYLLEKDIVLVVPQYRLGPLGFLSTKSDAIPGNAGVLDILLALKWVQENIGYFGGDPNNVTLFGQSAGAAIISAMTYSPIVPHNLFHKIILQSGASMCSWLFDKTPIENARDMIKYAGCDPDGPLDDINKAFMDMDVKSLLQVFHAHNAIGMADGINSTGGNRLTVGGPSGFLPVSPYQLMKSGKIRKDLPMMAGTTKQDGVFVFSVLYDVILRPRRLLDDKSYISYKLLNDFFDLMGPHEESGGFVALYSSKMFSQKQINEGNFYNMIDALVDMSTTYGIKAPILRTVQTNAFYNPNQTYLYTFDYKGEHTRFGYGANVSRKPYTGGIHHSDDIIYLFPYPPNAAKLNPADTEMAKKMVDLWTSFASTGVPSSPGQTEWRPFTNVTGPYMHINQELSMGEDYADEFDRTLKDARKDKRLSLQKARTT